MSKRTLISENFSAESLEQLGRNPSGNRVILILVGQKSLPEKFKSLLRYFLTFLKAKDVSNYP